MSRSRLGLVVRVFALLVAAAVSGCSSGGGGGGGGGKGGAGGGGGSTTPGASGTGFRVVSTDPADGATTVAPTITPLRVTFSEPIDAVTINAGSVYLETSGRRAGAWLVAVAGTPDVSLAPDAGLLPSTTYEIVVTTAVRAASGASLGAQTTSSFTTDAAGATRTHTLLAGAAVSDITPPVGVPLGGFGEGDRRLSFPDLDPTNWNTLFHESEGIRDPILAKALVLDDGVERVALVAVDLIGATGDAVDEVAGLVAAQGSSITRDRIFMFGSHTHSGPGAISRRTFWEIAAMDLYQPAVFHDLTQSVAQAVLDAEARLEPARLGYGTGQLTGIARNRRAGVSPVFTRDSIDPMVSVIAVDRASDGGTIATVYNYAIHGLAFWDDNMLYSADIMGDASRYIEARIGGVALYANGAEGDITPNARGDAESVRDGGILGQAALDVRQSLQAPPTADVEIAAAEEVLDLGQPMIHIPFSTLQQALGGQAALSTILGLLGGSAATIPIPNGWMDHEFRFAALRLNRLGVAIVPGEAIHTLGLEIKQDGIGAGFDSAFCFGLANGHMAYITTFDEYQAGGYEGIATFFGPQTGATVRQALARQLGRIHP